MSLVKPLMPMLAGGAYTITQAGAAGVLIWSTPVNEWWIQNGTASVVYVLLNDTAVTATNWDYKIAAGGTLTSNSRIPVGIHALLVAAGASDFVFYSTAQNSSIRGWPVDWDVATNGVLAAVS